MTLLTEKHFPTTIKSYFNDNSLIINALKPLFRMLKNYLIFPNAFDYNLWILGINAWR